MLKKVIGIFVVAAGLALTAMVALAAWLNTPPPAAAGKVSLVIKKGESLEAIARGLEERGVIRSALFLRAYSRLRGTEQGFRQGSYAFDAASSTAAIHDLVVSGQQVNLKVTIPEGYTARQIAAVLEARGICGAKEFLAAVKDAGFLKGIGLPGATADGYLFPDTYLFPEGYPPDAVVRYMVDNFRANLDEAVPGWTARGEKAIRSALVVASIVEREYISPAEAPLMASVFFNRLSVRKPLESCATVVYVMTEELGLAHPARLFYRDLARESAYNTYLHAGLPPGPISNPGLVALKAAFEPAKSDFLYFVLKAPNARQHNFSKTFAEHSQATVLYLKGQG